MQRSLFEQGKIARDRGDWDEADRCFTEASKVFDADQAEDAIANSEGLSYDLERALGLRGNRAVVEHRRGNLAAAAEMIDRSLRFTREHGTISNVTTLLVRLAAVRIDQERPEDARASAVEAHRLAAQLGMRDELEQSRRLLELLDDQDPSPQLPTPE